MIIDPKSHVPIYRQIVDQIRQSIAVGVYGPDEALPSLRKLAQEIITWEDKSCYNHMVAYAGLTPPLIADDLSHNDGLRFEQARVIKELGQKYQNGEWSNASTLFAKSLHHHNKEEQKFQLTDIFCDVYPFPARTY